MKIKFALVMLMCGWATITIAQDKTQEKAAEGQCLIVVPRPVFKFEFRDSYNLAKENVKDVYKSKDLTPHFHFELYQQTFGRSFSSMFMQV
jgi:hypothetical protein